MADDVFPPTGGAFSLKVFRVKREEQERVRMTDVFLAPVPDRRGDLPPGLLKVELSLFGETPFPLGTELVMTLTPKSGGVKE